MDASESQNVSKSTVNSLAAEPEVASSAHLNSTVTSATNTCNNLETSLSLRKLDASYQERLNDSTNTADADGIGGVAVAECNIFMNVDIMLTILYTVGRCPGIKMRTKKGQCTNLVHFKCQTYLILVKSYLRLIFVGSNFSTL